MKEKQFIIKILCFLTILSFCSFVLPALIGGAIGFIFLTASDGLRGHGHTYNAEMAVSTTITVGNGVTQDVSGYVILATANGYDCLGVAIETKTTGSTDHYTITFIVHGFVDAIILSTGTDVDYGDPLKISATAGLFALFVAATDPPEEKKATCFEKKDISADDACLVFFCP